MGNERGMCRQCVCPRSICAYESHNSLINKFQQYQDSIYLPYKSPIVNKSDIRLMEMRELMFREIELHTPDDD